MSLKDIITENIKSSICIGDIIYQTYYPFDSESDAQYVDTHIAEFMKFLDNAYI